MNNAAVNIYVHIFVWAYSFPLDRYLGVELLGYMTVLYLTFWETAKLFLKVIALLDFFDY